MSLLESPSGSAAQEVSAWPEESGHDLSPRGACLAASGELLRLSLQGASKAYLDVPSRGRSPRSRLCRLAWTRMGRMGKEVHPSR